MNDINQKSSPNLMRILIKRLRENNYDSNIQMIIPKKNLTIRDMLKITRRLNENVNMEASSDQPNEEKKFRNMFNDMIVSIEFDDLIVKNDRIVWSGIVDGMFGFLYEVTPDESTSKMEIIPTVNVTPDNPDNEKITKKLETYFEAFKKYWRENLLQQ